MPRPYRFALAALMAIEAATFLLVALLHTGTPVSLGPLRLDEPRIVGAAVVETLCALALVIGSYALAARRPWARSGAIAGHVVAGVGTIVGVVALAVGAGPRTELNDLYHRVIVATLLLGLVVLWRFPNIPASDPRREGRPDSDDRREGEPADPAVAASAEVSQGTAATLNMRRVPAARMTVVTRRVLLRQVGAGVALTLAAPAQISRGQELSSPAALIPGTLEAARPEGDSAMDDAMLEALVQSIHPEKPFFYLPGMANEASVAALYGVDAEQYGAIRARFDAAARDAAAELLADPAFAARVDRLPFAPAAVVVGVGESDMDDLQSWLEILRHLLDLRRPQDRISVVNHGISGLSTTEALARFMATLGQRPDWILCGLGGNDAVRYGRAATKTRVSPAETEKNLVELRHLAALQPETEWVWLTRWAIDEERIATFPPFQMGQFTLRSADIDAVSDIVRQLPGIVVDLGAAFGRPPTPAFLREDGLHPSLAGHQVIARAVIEQLTS